MRGNVLCFEACCTGAALVGAATRCCLCQSLRAGLAEPKLCCQIPACGDACMFAEIVSRIATSHHSACICNTNSQPVPAAILAENLAVVFLNVTAALTNGGSGSAKVSWL